MQEVSDKSSRLTGNALHVAEELFDLLIGHFHEVILVKPANVLRNKVGCDSEDSRARNLTNFGRMFEPTNGVSAFFPLAGKIGTQLNG